MENSEQKAAAMAETLRKIKQWASNKDVGVPEATFGDTHFDSESVAYGYNLALEAIENLLNESGI